MSERDPLTAEKKVCEYGNMYDCPHMEGVAGDTDMEYEHYECKVCGLRYKLDYEEMR